MTGQISELKNVIIKFAGDSGDGMQLTGTQFAETSALYGNDIVTFPDFPAEIRAPIGTVPGVSGYQLQFSSSHILTVGDAYDVLVVLNAAALKTNIKNLKKNGILIVNTDGFDDKNLRLAKLEQNPLDDETLNAFQLIKLNITDLTKKALAEFKLGNKETERCKNMYVLGIVLWLFNRNIEHTKEFIEKKFKNKPEISTANLSALQSGYHFAETTELINSRYEVKPAKMKAGEYRSINGNQALALGLLAASINTDLPLFLGTYPITPASDILHELSKHKSYGVVTFQAEDEIAGVCSAIGASYGGSIGVTTSSGPGIALKMEAIGLATMLELPLVICNIQRGGPSTGLPTKTEQADLLQALYGRNGECPLVVMAAHSPSDCYEMAYMAVKIAIEHTVPVMLLSDGYIANGAEPWMIKHADELPEIKQNYISQINSQYLPYQRNENLSRNISIPGSRGLENRIGGLEKENITGNISYDPANHELMVKLRAEKVQKVAEVLPEIEYIQGGINSDILIIGWGSTFGTIHTATEELNNEGYSIAQLHLNYINPLPKNLEDKIRGFKHVIVPELNNGQLIKILREKYLIDMKGVNKIQGQPFHVNELKEHIKQMIQ